MKSSIASNLENPDNPLVVNTRTPCPSGLVSLAASEVQTLVKLCFRHSREKRYPYQIRPGDLDSRFRGNDAPFGFLVQRGWVVRWFYERGCQEQTSPAAASFHNAYEIARYF